MKGLSKKSQAVVKCQWCGKDVAVGVNWERPGDGTVIARVRNRHVCPIEGTVKHDASGQVVFDEF